MKEPTVGFPARRTLLVVLSAIGLVVVATVVAIAQPQATPPLTSATPATTAPLTQPSSPEGTEPPFNGLEMKVINALGKLGITGQRAQLPFRDASIWAELGPGSQLFVNAYPLGTVDRSFTVIDERRLAGIVVQHVRRPSYPAGTISSRFECSGDEYWVSGDVPPSFADMDAFVERFIGALAC